MPKISLPTQIVIVFIFIFSLIDFSSRLYLSDISGKGEAALATSSYPTYMRLEDATAKNILSAYQQFDNKKKTKVNKPAPGISGISLQQQQQQQGELDKLFADNLVFTLKAVIENSRVQGERYALLEQLDIKTGKKELVRLALNNALFGYKLVNISANYINLTAGERTINLRLYRKASEKNNA